MANAIQRTNFIGAMYKKIEVYKKPLFNLLINLLF